VEALPSAARFLENASVPWVLTALPLLLLLFAAWLVAGLALARAALRLRGGVEVAVLALPLGLLAHLLVANALAYVVGSRAAIVLTLVVSLGGGLLALRRGAPAPLAWELGRRARVSLLLAALALGLGVWELGSLEVFGDDGAHASMAHLLAAGQFPLRFQCNPALRAGYHYGGDLLAAEVMVIAGAPPFEALDPVRAACVTSVLMLAFLAGWRPRRSIASGLLAVLLLLTVGPMLWIFVPLAHAGLAGWAVLGVPALVPLVEAARALVANPWHFAVVTPGFITPTYGHAHRALAWGFAPFQVLLFLALLEAPLTRRRRSIALGLVLGAATLTQTASLAVLLPLLALHVAFARPGRRAARSGPALDFDAATVLGLALVLWLTQGGPLTDGLRDRLAGVHDPLVAFRFDPVRLPSCRDEQASLACLLLSAGNLGLTPFLLPWAALRSWRGAQRARLLLVGGCAAAYVAPFFLRYDFYDWNLQRLLTYASWTLVVILAPLLGERLRAGGRARAWAVVAVVSIGFQGLVALGVIVEGSHVRDRVDRAFFRVGPLDERMMRYGPALPKDALLLDSAPCLKNSACRAALLFGRYAVCSDDRLRFEEPGAVYREARADPRPETLRRLGYTHVYLDDEWLDAMSPEARARFAGGAFELVGSARAGHDVRLLLRVCAPQERCALHVPGVI
jgi:hypothetical protein